MPSENLWLTRQGQTVLKRNPIKSDGNAKENSDESQQAAEAQLPVLWLYSLCDGKAIHTTNHANKLVDTKLLTSPQKYPTVPFDFRIFGLGLYGDVVSGSSFEGVAKFWEQTADRWPKGKDELWNGEPVIVYDADKYKFAVDIAKSSWFCYQRMLGYKTVLGKREPYVESETEVKIERKFDKWVPTYVKVRGTSGVIEVYLTWMDPDSFDKKVFSLDHIRGMMATDIKSSSAKKDRDK